MDEELREVCCSGSKQLRPVRNTLLENLENQKADFEERLSAINQAIAYIKSNPELQNFMNCIRRVGL